MTKEKILEVLKEKEKSASEISVNIGRNFYIVTNLLKELVEEGKIEKLEVGKHILWKLKEEEKNGV